MLRRPWETCIVLIALSLTGILFIGVLAIGSHAGRSRSARVGLDIRSIQGALKLYRARTGKLPEDSDGLSLLVGRELEQIPKDPWGRPYIYQQAGDGAEVWTYGRDGKVGGEGQDRDLFSLIPGDLARAEQENPETEAPALLLLAATIWGPALALLGALKFARARKELKSFQAQSEEPLGLHVEQRP